MPRRPSRPRKAIPFSKPPGPPAGLRHELTRRKKTELVDILVELAEADRGVLRQLTARVDGTMSPDELIAATRQAIADATHFDKRDINHNFAYDYQAYDEVKRNLGRLIASGQWKQALSLALELMESGSEQVGMSDEGLMTEDIEACLNVVIEALRKCDLPAAEVIAWCTAMRDADQVGFIANESLQSLRNHLQATAPR
jgi:hypothetical protein